MPHIKEGYENLKHMIKLLKDENIIKSINKH